MDQRVEGETGLVRKRAMLRSMVISPSYIDTHGEDFLVAPMFAILYDIARRQESIYTTALKLLLQLEALCIDE